MRRHLAILLALAFLCALPAVAQAARPPAATLAQPSVRWVRLGVVTPAADETSPLAGRVVARVLVRHAGIADAAPGLVVNGTITVVLSRFEGDRNHSIAGGTAWWGLPVTADGLEVLYQVTVSARQSAAVRAAAAAGTLRALVLVDQRARARGRTTVRAGTFAQQDATLPALPLPVPIAEPPALAGSGRRVLIDAGADGRGIVRRVELPLPGGRTLRLTTGGTAAHGLVPADGSAGPLTGTVAILAADGATVAELPAPSGFSLAVSPTGRRRGVLTWPSFEVPGADPVVGGRALLAPLR